MVNGYSTPGYDDVELSILVIEPKHFPKTYVEAAEFDCLHDEGVFFVEKLQSEGVSVELYEVKGACHGFEAVMKSIIVTDLLNKRIKWIRSIFD